MNFDLLTRTGYEVEDIGGALSWGAFESFIKNIGPESALGRELGYSTGWNTQTKTNAILADIYDLLQLINRNIVASHSKGRVAAKIKPYPRPGKEDEKKVGKGALPVKDLRAWFEEKRKQHKQKKKKGGKK